MRCDSFLCGDGGGGVGREPEEVQGFPEVAKLKGFARELSF